MSKTKARLLTEIMSLSETYPNSAKDSLEKFTRERPGVIWGHIRYAGVLITLNELDKAEEELNIASQLMRERGFATDNSQGFQNVREALLFNRLRLFAFQNKVQEFLNLYASHLDLFKGVKQSDIVYFRNRVGVVPPQSYVLTYYGQQVVDYDQDRFIEFVKNHSVEEIAEEEENFIHFKPDFPLEKVVEEIKKYIPSAARKNGKYINNEYVFRYSGCGSLDGKECDYFMVTTLNDSDHFMTMHPVPELGDIGYVDLNYLKNKGEAQVKSLSRIDRFNRRYRNVLNVETG